MNVASPQYQRMLLIRTDRVGDLVLSTPAIASFRRSWPDARIEALVNDYTEPVLRHNPDIDALHVLPRFARVGQARETARSLGRGLDLAVALAPRTPDYRLTAWTRAPRRLGYVYRRRYFSRLAAWLWLTDHYVSGADPALADRHPERPVIHEVHQVSALVPLAGGRVASEELVLRLGAEDVAFAQTRVPAGAICLSLSPRWLAPDFGTAALRRLITRLASDADHVLVAYGSDVAAQANQLRAEVRKANVSWLGELPLLQWAAALARCGVVVTVDTGATHVAAALKLPLVVVFERRWYRLTTQEWGPWRVPHAHLRKPPRGADLAPFIDDIAQAAFALRTEHVM